MYVCVCICIHIYTGLCYAIEHQLNPYLPPHRPGCTTAWVNPIYMYIHIYCYASIRHRIHPSSPRTGRGAQLLGLTLYIYTHIYTCTCDASITHRIHPSSSSHRPGCTTAHIYIYIYIYTHTHTHTHTHTYIYIYIYIYVCVCVCKYLYISYIDIYRWYLLPVNPLSLPCTGRGARLLSLYINIYKYIYR